MLKVAKAAFAVAYFWGLSDIHECPGHLYMAPYPLDKQTTVYNSSYNWLMSLAKDLHNCFVWYVKVKMAPMDAIWLCNEDIAFARHFVATRPSPTLPPCTSASDIDYTSKRR